MDAAAPLGASRLTSALDGSRSKYIGLALVLAWHDALWFVPTSFPEVFLLDDRITYAWLVTLFATAMALVVLSLMLSRQRHLPTSGWLVWTAAVVTSAGTACLTYGVAVFSPLVIYAAGAVAGVGGAVLWVLWGEHHARRRSKFTMSRIGQTFALVVLVVLAIDLLLPRLLAPGFVCLLPLVSAGLLRLTGPSYAQRGYPHLLPKKTAMGGFMSILSVCAIAFVTALVCYYTVAIVPWDQLWPTTDYAFALGILAGAVFILVFAGLHHFSPSRYSVFRIFPWLVLFAVLACLLYVWGSNTHFSAFMVSLALSSAFELFLIMYMGSLMSSGHIPAAVAFGLSGGVIRMGIVIGNGLALTYERIPWAAQSLVVPTFLVLAAILTALLIPLVRQEYAILELAKPPETRADQEACHREIAAEFHLSNREEEVLLLLARGLTAAAIAQRLVISRNTVDTHVQHIYAKMGIHRRCELIAFLNKEDQP